MRSTTAASNRLRNTLLAFSLASAAGLAALVTAGPIDPPAGAIAPTYKTLDQVEPRIPIGPTTTPGDQYAVYRITKPGSYYLTGNLTVQDGRSGISIASSDVNIDLRGFVLTGGENSTVGITVDPYLSDLTIRNGTVRTWAYGGINAFNCSGGTYENLLLESNSLSGLTCGRSSNIRDCQFRANAGPGLYTYVNCLVADCTSTGNDGDGISVSNGCVVDRCVSNDNTGDGIETDDGVKISDCGISFNDGCGVRATWRCTITGNHINANGLHGVIAGSQSRVSGNTIEVNGNLGTGYGVFLDTGITSVAVEDNTILANDVGVTIAGTSNLVVRNFVRANTTNFSVVGGNIVGPIVTSANIAAQTNPSANYSN